MKPGKQSISKNPPSIPPLDKGGDSWEVDISVVIPLFNEEKNVEILSRTLIDVLSKGKESFEIVYVDDGSTDKTLQILKALHEKHNFIKIIKLARNFGQQRAESAGIRYARGKIIITMDGDLQYNPQDIPRFLKKIEEGYDAVIGYRESRKEGFFTRRLPSRIANIIMSFLSGVHFKDIGCPFIAFRRDLKEGIENYGEAGEGNSSFFILWRASKIGEIEIDASRRESGRTSYRFTSLFTLLLEIIIAFSIRPFQIFILVFTGATAIFLSIVLLLSSIFRLIPPTGTLYVILSFLFFFAGIELVALGIINERISRMTSRLQKKPLYIIENIYE